MSDFRVLYCPQMYGHIPALHLKNNRDFHECSETHRAPVIIRTVPCPAVQINPKEKTTFTSGVQWVRQIPLNFVCSERSPKSTGKV